MQQLGLPFIIEQPAVRNNEVSMFKLDEYVKLMELPQANHTISPQCAYGAAAAKLTSYIYFIVDLSDMPTRCLHPLRTWYARDGTSMQSKHPPAHGIVTFHASPDLAQHTAAQGFITKKLSAYPDLLNRDLSARMAKSIYTPRITSLKPQSSVPLAHQWDDRRGKERIRYSVHLRGQPAPDEKTEAEHTAVGGLRDAATSISKLHHEAGRSR